MYKQNKIMDAALSLFGDNGIHATTTISIAKLAKVSEGLVFKYFENKQNLLEAVLARETDRIMRTLDRIDNIQNPWERLQYLLEWPKHNYHNYKDFWNMLFSLRFGHIHLLTKYYRTDLFDRFIKIAETSLRQLDVKNAGAHALSMWLMLTGYFVQAESLYPTQETMLLRHILTHYKKVCAHSPLVNDPNEEDNITL